LKERLGDPVHVVVLFFSNPWIRMVFVHMIMIQMMMAMRQSPWIIGDKERCVAEMPTDIVEKLGITETTMPTIVTHNKEAPHEKTKHVPIDWK
jgi:hypothetical protein